LRNLDRDATWSKSGYHGWVYGYSLHLSCNRAGFPKLAQVETASVDESAVFEQKKEALFLFDQKQLSAIMAISKPFACVAGQPKAFYCVAEPSCFLEKR
jgi:hypothetical protein